MATSLLRRCAHLALGIALAATASAQRVSNLSSMGQVGPGAKIMTTGFVVTGPAGSTEQVLLRAVGPTLKSTFGIAAALADPTLTIRDSAQNLIAPTNKAWSATDTALMNNLGAFALVPGSKDCDLVVSLAPGSYTVTISPDSGDTGIAMLEVYEVNPSSTGRLINISNSVFVGPGAATATNGFIIGPGTGTRTLLLRAVGPGLAQFGVNNYVADPTLTLASSGGAVLANNDDWFSPVNVAAASGALLAADFTVAGAFNLPTTSADSALVTTLTPGRYTMNVVGKNNGSGVGLVEIYDITPTGGAQNVAIAAATSADTSGSNPAVFTVSRSGDSSQAITVSYATGGTAVAGTDYAPPSGVVTIPAGATSATITVQPNPKLASGPSTTLSLTLMAGSSYGITGTGTATVGITTVAGTLYVAKLAGPAGATAAGTATIILNPNGTLGTVNISFSGLSSTENVAHLVIGTPGSGTFVNLVLPYGQVTNTGWTFSASGQYSSSDLLNALKNGQIYVEIDSQNYPTGELQGQFVTSSGSQTFSAPGAAPSIDLTQISQQDAARFLQQTTFGVTAADMAAVRAQGYTQWIANQMALPASSQLTATRQDAAMFPNTGQYPITQNDRQAAWWKIAVTGQDQLRQRVAFALSQIFVVSDVASSLAQQPEALANYYDMLSNDAFGNYRQLIQDVTLSPVMGNYLNMLRSAPANAAKGTAADENYAREIMQLFTIGLNLLNPDGSLQLDSSGQPIPTYNQATIVQTANVFTGWAYHTTAATPNFTGGAADWYNPMQLYPASHDNTAKTIVGGVVLPANQGGAADLKLELDTLFNHQNTAPFFARGLIQRLVTSNPSPGYVYRVAQVFANDGTGVRGNIGAVVKAILTDYEARSPAMLTDASFGKLKEPLIRQTQIYRSFNAAAANGRFGIGALFTPDQTVNQAALRSPTVFNYYLPDFVLPGPLAQAGLYAPEYQITTATTAINAPNLYYNSIYTATAPAASQPVLDLTALTTAADTATMVGTLNTMLAGGTMSATAQQAVVNAVNALPAGTTPLAKAQFALYLVSTTSSGAVQE